MLRPRVTGETVRVEEDLFVRQDGTLVPVPYSLAPMAIIDYVMLAPFSSRISQRDRDEEGGYHAGHTEEVATWAATYG